MKKFLALLLAIVMLSALVSCGGAELTRGVVEGDVYKNESLGLNFNKPSSWVYSTDEEIAAMQVFAKKVAAAIKETFPCIKVGQAVLGLEVPHAHIHLVPMQSEKDMLFTNPKLKLTPEEFAEIAEKIQKKIA